MEIFKLFGSILVDNEEANKSISDTDDKAKSLGSKFGDMIGTAAKWGAAISAGAIAGGAALLGIANKASETASRVADMSAKIGMSTQGFQEWDYALGQAGVDVGVLQGGFKKLNGNIDDASSGNEKAIAKFKELGISMNDLKTMSPEEVFNKAITGLQNMEDGAHKSALASDLLGKSSTEMGAILNGTATDLQAAKDRANELGLVLSDEAVNAGDNFGDTMENVTKSLGAIATDIGVSVMPAIQGFLDWVITHMPEIQAGIETAMNAAKTVIDNTKNAVQFLSDKFTEYKGVLEPILAGIAAGAGIFGLYTLAINASTIATGIWTTVTGVATVAGGAFAAVLAFITSPIGLVVIAIGLLVAAGVALYQNWDTVSAFLKETWEGIKSKASEIWDGLTQYFTDLYTNIKAFFTEWGPTILAIIAPFLGIPLIIYQNWDKIKAWLSEVWQSVITSIKTYVANMIQTFEDYKTKFKETGTAIFTSLWDGIKGVWDSISNWVSEKVSWLSNKLAFWRSGQSEMSSSSSKSSKTVDGSHANGLSYVPFDGYVAELHKGERVLTASENRNLGSGVTVMVTGNTIMNDRDADRLGDLIVNRLRGLGIA